MREPWLLIAGGDSDPNIVRLLRASAARGLRVSAALTGKSGVPRLTWRIGEKRLLLDGQAISPTAAFLREDVFGSELGTNPQEAQKAAVWHETCRGWLAGFDDIRWMNKGFLLAARPNKLRNLHLAMEAGFNIPRTLISNEVDEINGLVKSGEWVHKPVNGGAHCQPLSEISSRTGILSYPMKLQERLNNPEYRIFKVGSDHLAFEILSEQLDHRQDATAQIRPVQPDRDLCDCLDRLCAALMLDYAAIDLKTSPSGGTPVFLEINSNPMFSGFDQFSRGKLVAAMLDWLAA